MDSTAFGGDVPTVPQWLGPPRSIVQVQALLYASLAASLFSAFLAMLGKQWLNRCTPVDMRGTVIERSQNRQRKFDGIVNWYFDHVMESLPLMLQIALLLLGCALSRYLWEINVTIASVVLGATAFGITFYAFIVVAGAVFASCPYQTPGAQILRFLWQKVLSRTAFSAAKSSAAQRSVTQHSPEQIVDWKVTALDFRCISWLLQTSLDRCINELALKFLGSVLTLPGFKTAIVVDCLNVLISCVSVTGDRVVVLPGSERLAEIAATCLLRTISHAMVVQPASNVLRHVYQRYMRVFPPTADLQSLHFYHTVNAVHNVITDIPPDDLDWQDIYPSTPPTPANLLLAHSLVKIAWYQKFGSEGRGRRITRWMVRFSLHFLVWDPKPPVPVIVDCLSIIAVDFGCDLSQSHIMKLDKRYACVTQLCGPLAHPS